MTQKKRPNPCARNIDPRRIEVMDDMTANMLRNKTGAERLQIASNMYGMARQTIMAHLQSQHPEWNASEVQRQTVKRLSHGAI